MTVRMTVRWTTVESRHFYVTVCQNETDINCVEVWRENEMFIVMY